jgi:hypothetical protein
MGAWPRIKLIKAKHPTITLTKHQQTALAYYFISLAVKAHIFPDAKAAGVLDLFSNHQKMIKRTLEGKKSFANSRRPNPVAIFERGS